MPIIVLMISENVGGKVESNHKLRLLEGLDCSWTRYGRFIVTTSQHCIVQCVPETRGSTRFQMRWTSLHEEGSLYLLPSRRRLWLRHATIAQQ